MQGKAQPRILHIIPSLIKGGAERLVCNIAQALVSNKLAEVMLIQLREGDDYAFLQRDFEHELIPSKLVPSLRGTWHRQTAELNKAIEDFRPDIIHSHLFEAEMVSRDTLFKGVTYFTHLHDNMPQFANLKLSNMLQKQTITNAYEKHWLVNQYRKCNNEFIAISKDAESYFKNTLPADLQKIHLLNNAIEVNRFLRKEKQVLDPEVLRMVSTGSLVNKKNQKFLVEVVKALNQQGKRVVLHILGDGPNRAAIEHEINASGLEDQIFLEGNVDQVERYLHQANFYVHPATYEPLGLVIIEAMAASLACVVLDGRGNRDIHQEGKNGFMIQNQDAKAFAQALVKLHNAPKLYEQITNYAVNYAADFDINKYVGKLMTIYLKSLKNKP